VRGFAAKKKEETKLRTNEAILSDVSEVRFVGLDNVHTVMDTEDALKIAREHKLDLVEVRFGPQSRVAHPTMTRELTLRKR
jgi:translation initiation factor IF-3